MASYVQIEFDRTPPNVNVYAPKYTTNTLINRIVIEADEELSDYQEIYVIDTNGNRHDYTFNKESYNRYVGEVKFSNFGYGIITMYVVVSDSVGNKSNIMTASIEIMDSVGAIKMVVSDRERKIILKDDDGLTESNITHYKMIIKDKSHSSYLDH